MTSSCLNLSDTVGRTAHFVERSGNVAAGAAASRRRAITYGVCDTEKTRHQQYQRNEEDHRRISVAASVRTRRFQPASSRRLRVRQLKKRAQAIVKDRRLNIRLSALVLKGLRARAAEEGLPYQTLIARVLRQFVTGRLVDRGSKTSRPTAGGR
jgi:predicted DNA binding CopG/RHH family protein